MPSRRSVLHLLGAGLVTTSGGCAGIGDSASVPEDDDVTTTNEEPNTTITPSDEPTATTKSDEATNTGEPALSATAVDPGDVPDGTTLVPVSSRLLDLVSTAATTEGWVDLATTGGAYNDDPLVVGGFDAVEFRDETFGPATKFAYFAQEASYQYRLEAANESEFDGDAITYTNLSADEQAVVDVILENGSFDIGHHEEHPTAARSFGEYESLRVEGNTYQIVVVVGDMASHHMLRLDPATPGEDAQVVTISDEPVPDAIRSTVERAIADGSSGIDAPDAIRSFIEDTEYVLTPHVATRLELGTSKS